jgi:hypothetical protein
MKNILSILILISLYSCSHDDDPQPTQTNNNTHTANTYTSPLVLEIGTVYLSYDSLTRTDTILSSSYWKVNSTQKNIPITSVLSKPSAISQVWPYFNDTINAVSGDSVTIHIELKHRWDYPSSGGGVFVSLWPHSGSPIGTFMCLMDTVVQTKTFIIP